MRGSACLCPGDAEPWGVKRRGTCRGRCGPAGRARTSRGRKDVLRGAQQAPAFPVEAGGRPGGQPPPRGLCCIFSEGCWAAAAGGAGSSIRKAPRPPSPPSALTGLSKRWAPTVAGKRRAAGAAPGTWARDAKAAAPSPSCLPAQGEAGGSLKFWPRPSGAAVPGLTASSRFAASGLRSTHGRPGHRAAEPTRPG